MAYKNIWTTATAIYPLTLAISPSAGDYLIGWCVSDAPGTPVIPSGWTQLGSKLTSTYDYADLFLIEKIADGTETSVTFGFPSLNALGGVISFDNVDQVTPLDVAVVPFSTSTGVTVADLTISPATSGTTLLHVRVVDGTSGNPSFTWSTQAGTTEAWTQRADLSDGYYNIAVATTEVPTNNQVTARSESTQTGGALAFLVAIRSSATVYTADVSESVSKDESNSVSFTANVPLIATTLIFESGGPISGIFQRNTFQNDIFQVFPPPSGGTTYTADISESGSESDSIAANELATVPLSDSESVSDTQTVLVQMSSSVTDTENLAEAQSSIVNAIVGLADSETVAETQSAVAARIVPLSDSESVAETISALIVAAASLTDSAVVSESPATIVVSSVGVSDTVGSSEAVSGSSTGTYTADISESIGSSDFIGTNSVYTQGLFESESSSDTIGVIRLTVSSLIETLGSAESLASVAYFSSGLTDTLSGSESASTQAIFGVSVSDSESSSDNLSLDRSFFEVLTDSLTTSEFIAAVWSLSADVGETVTSAEVCGSIETAVVSEASTANGIPPMTSNTTPAGVASASSIFAVYAAWRAMDGVNDALGWATSHVANPFPQWIQYQTSAPIVPLWYAVTSRNEPGAARNMKTWQYLASDDGGNTWDVLDTRTNVTDWGNIANIRKQFSVTATKAYTHHRLYITASNDATYVGLGVLEIGVAFSDSVGVNDLATVSTASGVAIGESEAAVESIGVGNAFAANVNDSETTGESLNGGLIFAANLAASEAISETVSNLLSAISYLNDSLGVGDLNSIQLRSSQTINESVGSAENLQGSWRGTVGLVESFLANESLAILSSFSANLNDSTSLGELFASGESISLTDSLSLLENVAVYVNTAIALQDLLNATDGVANDIFLGVNLEEIVSLTEGLRVAALGESLPIVELTGNILRLQNLIEVFLQGVLRGSVNESVSLHGDIGEVGLSGEVSLSTTINGDIIGLNTEIPLCIQNILEGSIEALDNE